MIDLIIGNQFSKKVIPLIESAKQSISIIVFDWRWYPNDPGNPVQLFNQALIRAQGRGLNIRVITNIKEVVSILSQQGIKAKKLITPNLVHCKFMIIDNEILVIGSHNYTSKAFTDNYEVSVVINDKDACNRLVSFFNALFV